MHSVAQLWDCVNKYEQHNTPPVMAVNRWQMDREDEKSNSVFAGD